MTSDLEEAEWQQVHQRHVAMVRGFVGRLTTDRSAAEDVVQEVLLRAWRTDALAGRDDRAARAWLCTVARRVLIDRWRSAAARHEVSTAEVDAPPVDDGTGPVLDRQVIADALGTLSPEHRDVVVAAYYEGQSVADMAARWQLPQGTVKSRLHYGLRSLRTALLEKGVTRR